MELPRSVQEIADVIGRERALFLIGQLPSYTVRDKRYPNAIHNRLILYVPKVISPTDDLPRILGWNDAMKLVKHFGGELLYPSPCTQIHRQFIVNTIRRLNSEGMAHKAIAELLEVSERTVKRHCTDNPHKDAKATNDNTPQRHLAALGQ